MRKSHALRITARRTVRAGGFLQSIAPAFRRRCVHDTRERETHPGGLVDSHAMVSFGNAELMLNMHGKPGRHDVSLWFYTDKVDELYQLLKAR